MFSRGCYDSYAARWRGTPVSHFNGIGYIHSNTLATKKPIVRTRWREKSAKLREQVRRDKQAKTPNSVRQKSKVKSYK